MDASDEEGNGGSMFVEMTLNKIKFFVKPSLLKKFASAMTKALSKYDLNS
jgi:hypothetical protein